MTQPACQGPLEWAWLGGKRVRGLKGLWWEPEQYLGWPAFLEGAGYDFLMLCYTFCPESGLTWRQPFLEAELAVIRQLGEECAGRGITLCLALHPLIGGQAWAPEQAAVRFHPTSGQGWFLRYWQARRPSETLQPDLPIRYGSAEDLALLAAKCRQVTELGVSAVALCLDDVEPGATPEGFPDLAAAHVWLVRGLREETGDRSQESGDQTLTPALSHETRGPSLRASPRQREREHAQRERATMWLVVPTYYWTAGAKAQAGYTAGLAQGLPPEVGVFWTGTEVRAHAITAAQAREAAALFGRRPRVWLNYASNDSFRFAVQLPPDRPPAADLATETAGLLLNSTRQIGLAHLDALVIGAYLADPSGYDHEQAVRRAVVEMVGEEAAPLLLRIMAAWQAVPDVRALQHDLMEGGRSFLDRLLERLRPAVAEIDEALGQLGAVPGEQSTLGRQIWLELTAGAERLWLLMDALEVLDGEAPPPGPLPTAVERGRHGAREALRARLKAAGPEAACDAEAILMLDPATMLES